MLHALNNITSTKSKGTPTRTWEAAKYFLTLTYAASNPDAKIIFHASDMVYKIYLDDTAYLVCPEKQSRAGGYYYLGNKKFKQSI